jgi:signal transduction histidine kinase
MGRSPRGNPLFPPEKRPFALWHIGLGVLLGVILGVLVGDPISRIIRNINEFAQKQVPLKFGPDILTSFTPKMWPMIILYAVLGAALGALLSWVYWRLKRDRLRLETLHEEFELQVASLRHHYKNLAIGLQGFSSRIKRKMEGLKGEPEDQIGKMEHTFINEFKKETDNLRGDIEILEATAQRLTNILGHELFFLKALTSESLTPETRDLYPLLISSIDDLLSWRFRDKEIRVEVDGRPLAECRSSLTFPFQSYPVEIILHNLLSNAMNFGDHIQVRVSDQKDQVRIEVEDNGPGLEIDTLQNLIMPAAGRRQVESTHLGLKVTLYLISKIGGNLEINSESGQGSKFMLTLPKGQRKPWLNLAR